MIVRMPGVRTEFYLVMLVLANSTCYSTRLLEHVCRFSEFYAIKSGFGACSKCIILRGGGGSLDSMFTASGDLIYDPTRCGALDANPLSAEQT